jgi:hypothetical protein
MYQTTPVSVATSTITINNPSDGNQNPPAVAVQIQNNSQYQLTNNLTADIVQPNYALTIQIPIGFTPLILFVLNFTAPTGTIGTEWLEFGESPSRPDGALQPSQALSLPWKYQGLFNPVSGTTLTIAISPACTGVIVTTNTTIGAAYLYNMVQQVPISLTQVILLQSGGGDYLYWIGPLPNTLPTPTGGPQQLGVEIVFNASGAVATSFEVNQPIDFASLGSTFSGGNGGYSNNGINVETTGVLFTQSVSNPTVGSDWSYTLPYSYRLSRVYAEYSASAAVATRYPSLIINGGFGWALTASGITASGIFFVQATKMMSAPALPIQMPPSANVQLSGFTDLGVLPYNSTISSSTASIQAGDQWSNIQLAFTPQ